jgi:bifunctional DNase/RNase
MNWLVARSSDAAELTIAAIVLLVLLILVPIIVRYLRLRKRTSHALLSKISSGPRSDSSMYERFTDRARKVMQLANQEAQRFHHEYIGTEHILLGLINEGNGVAANVLKNLGLDLRRIRLEVEKLIQSGPDMMTMGKLPQKPRAKKVIEYAMEEARDLNHNYVGTEHILLGLLRENGGVAAQVLMNLGLKLDEVRAEILALLGYPERHTANAAESPATGHERPADQNGKRCDFAACNEKAMFDLSYVEDRRCVRERHLCQSHACPELDAYQNTRCSKTRSGPECVLEGAKQFDIDLIGFTRVSDRQVVYLREVGGLRLVQIIIGEFEASSLSHKVKGVTPPRPLTYDAMAIVIRALDAVVQDVIVDRFEEHVYYAKVRMRRGDELRIADIRPSDAFMLALAFDCPIFFTNEVLEQTDK